MLRNLAKKPIGNRGPLPQRVLREIKRQLDTSNPAMRRAIDVAAQALLERVLEDYDAKSEGRADSLGRRWVENLSGKRPIGVDTGELRDAIKVEVGPRGGIRFMIDHDDVRQQEGRWFFLVGSNGNPGRRPFPAKMPTSYLRLFFQTLQRELVPLIEKAARDAGGRVVRK